MTAFERLYDAGQIERELVPHGTLVERIRAAGARIGAFFTPTGAGTQFAYGKEVRIIDGQEHVLEYGLRVDVSLVRATPRRTQDNLVYRLAPQLQSVMAITGLGARRPGELDAQRPQSGRKWVAPASRFGLVLEETAPGWSLEDVQAITEPQLSISSEFERWCPSKSLRYVRALFKLSC